MDILLWSVIFIASLAVLIKASDFFVSASERIGKALGLPAFIVGVTIVATGTSLPELISSIVAVTKGAGDIVAGNVIGSNIANISLVLAITAVISGKFKISFDILRVDLAMILGSAFMLWFVFRDGAFQTTDAIAMLLGMVIYFGYVIQGNKEDGAAEDDKGGIRPPLRTLDFGILTLAGFFIWLGAKYNVESIIKLSEILGVGKDVIALTAVSVGTSLPELVVSMVAIRKGNHEIAVGNVLGSNIFNTFAVTGIASLFGTIIISPAIVNLALPLMIAVTILFILVTLDREVNRWDGLLLLLIYALFIVELFRIHV